MPDSICQAAPRQDHRSLRRQAEAAHPQTDPTTERTTKLYLAVAARCSAAGEL